MVVLWRGVISPIDICPNCGTKTRKKGRKNGNGEKSRIDIEFDENDIT